ncbi:MAG TPA: alpha-(1-_3)-arabinofuranosyltransferase family protein, partial [Acidimicrobiales bacterium]|nr:alpha-(1->3)-arabinofuranosyltransferase family protein [Acidimicrobiales bacterium]
MSLTARRAQTRAQTRTDPDSPPPPWWRRPGIEYLLLAVLAFAPQLWAQPGVADSDTKSYLYLDPGRFLKQSAVMWDPTVGLGTVTHEQIGFLWPLGPWFWAVHALGIPLWVGQRLWIGLVLFAAAAGVVYLCRTLGLGGPGRFVAAAAYMLSPYWLQDVGRMGVLILPWAGLGWMIAFVVRGVRQGGWRYPALFALVWLTVSGNNASGPAYAVVAPLLWMAYAVFVAKEHTWRQAWATLWRTGLLTAGVSLWWAWALAIESKYGLNVLGVTEKVSQVAKTSLASEILRGLGYWYYYGADVAGPWAATSADYTQHLWLIVVSFAVPIAALGAAVVVRWRLRGFLVALVVVGMILAVGSHPYAAPSAVGGLIKSFMTKTTAGLALRSSDRATPMVILALAMLLGAGVSAVARSRPALGVVVAGMAVVLVGAANPAAFDGGSVLDRYLLPTPVPRYVTQAATTLDHERTGTRVLAIPSDNFGAYRYGNTNDPIWPGVLTRSFVTGQQLPIGSIPSYDLLYGLDTPMENRVTDPEAIAPLARLMSAGDVLLQNDIQYELYDRQPPQQLWSALQPTPKGLGHPTGFGSPVPNVAQIPMIDETTLAAAPDVTWPAPLEDFPVEDPRPVARAESTRGALVVAGDGVGLDDVADLGLLDTTSPVLYAGTLDSHPQALRSALGGGATLVVTDTDRKESFLWNVQNNNAGITLGPNEAQPAVTLDIFPKADTSAQSTAKLTGVASVAGSPSADPGYTPDLAIDGIDSSAWETRQGSNPIGKWWQVTLDQQITTNRITVLQPPPGDYSRAQWITKATLTFDGGSSRTVTLGPASRRGRGQVVTFPTQSFTTLRISVARTNRTGSSAPLSWDSPVGLSEVGVGGARAQSVLSMPTDLLSAAGPAAASHRLLLVMTRDREAPVAPSVDTEPVLARSFTLPATRTFTLTGTARLSTTAADATLDAALGRATSGPGAVVVSASSRLPGDTAGAASAALDGDPATMWSSAMGAANVDGAWLQVDRPTSSTVDHLDLVVAADGYHSVPTALRVQACDRPAADGRCPAGSPASSVALPAVADGPRQGATVAIPVHFPAVTGKDLTVTVTGARIELTKDWSSQTPIALPL